MKFKFHVNCSKQNLLFSLFPLIQIIQKSSLNNAFTRYRRKVSVEFRAAVDAVEEEEIEEMHSAQNKEHEPDFPRQRFDALRGVFGILAYFQRQTDITEINQVKPDDEQMIDRIGERFVAVKDVNQKNPAVFMQGLRDPNR